MEKAFAATARMTALLAWVCLMWVKSSAAPSPVHGSGIQAPFGERAWRNAPFLLAPRLCPEPGFGGPDNPSLPFTLRYVAIDDRDTGADCPGREHKTDAGRMPGIVPPPPVPTTEPEWREAGPRATAVPSAARQRGAKGKPARASPAFPPPWESGRRAEVTIRVNQTAQRLSVTLRGSPVEGLAAVAVSTGQLTAFTRTPDGLFRINPYEIRERRPSHFASRLLKRPVFLTHAIQIVGGIFMHDASPGAMAYLGQKRSYGCVRVDRRKMPEIFGLVQRHRFDTRVHIFHQES